MLMYLLALILPPVALFVCGRIFQGVFNLLVCILAIVIVLGTLGLGSGVSFVLWIAAIVHAVFVVHNDRADARVERAVKKAVKGGDSASE